MPGRSLKNYDMYLAKIQLYAKAVDVKIKYDPDDGEGSYNPTRRTLRVDPELPNSVEIAVLLHELGHSLDDTLVDKKTDHKLQRAYGSLYDGKPTKAQREQVMACELRAWDYGRVIAKKLRIPLGKWYDKAKEYCLKSYKEA